MLRNVTRTQSRKRNYTVLNSVYCEWLHCESYQAVVTSVVHFSGWWSTSKVHASATHTLIPLASQISKRKA